ncbi:MAG: GRP family sugar transporter [Defluviitaleaceae bacterium]|nr:GRP family sugar transporter [Defluviitaleaceae bacterium]
MELWFLYALMAAIFAALTTILAKIGLKSVDSHLATAIRTMAALAFAWVIVFVFGSQGEIVYMDTRTWIFLVLSGLATGGAWLCRFRALKLENVNKVTPITKSSTILTMILAFVFLSEPLGWAMAAGMTLMGIGTWLMLELKKNRDKAKEKGTGMAWLLFAALAAIFASLTAIFGSLGVSDMDASLWTAIRTVIVAIVSWAMVFMTGGQKKIKAVNAKGWVFLILSGIATGASWIFFYHALRLGNASHVVPIDQLSIIITMAFARIFLGERFSKQSLVGLAILTIGILLPSLISL